MTNYMGIFLRNALGEANVLPRVGRNATNSPDVINSGGVAVDDPQTAYGDTYDQIVGRPLDYGVPNYIYIRGKNYAEINVASSAALYWCHATQINTPSTWRPLTTASGANASPLGADPDAVAVTAEPFVWTPDQSSNPLVLIAAVSDATNPNPVLAYMKNSHGLPFVQWQSEQGGVAALQFTPPPPPKPQATYSFTGLLALDNSDDQPLSFTVLVNGGVVGDHFACSFDKFDANGNAMGLGNTSISQPNMTAGFNATVSPGFTSHFTFDYAAQNQTTPPTPSLTLQVAKIVSSGGGGDGPFGPGTGNNQAVVIAQFAMTTSLPG